MATSVVINRSPGGGGEGHLEITLNCQVFEHNLHTYNDKVQEVSEKLVIVDVL